MICVDVLSVGVSRDARFERTDRNEEAAISVLLENVTRLLVSGVEGSVEVT